MSEPRIALLHGPNLGMLGLDWFPHHPHESTGRWDNATIYTAPALDTLLL